VECKVELEAHVCATGGSCRAQELSEQVSKLREDVLDVIETVEPPGGFFSIGFCRAGGSPAPKSVEAEAVVVGPHFTVGEDLIGVRGFLEFLFRRLVPWAHVGVIHLRALAVGLLELVIVRGAGNGEDFVEISGSSLRVHGV
jgi:hypothetical protein